jgi:carboxypeptidase Q
MKRILSLLAVTILASSAAWADSAQGPLKEVVAKLGHEIKSNGKAYADLRELTSLGPRLSGTEGAARGVDWAKRKMKFYGFDRVFLQPVLVPRWSRGDVERATITSSAQSNSLAVTALGNSVGTPADGIEAGVVEVRGLDEVTRLGAAVRGKIVFYNRPMDPKRKNTFKAYGEAVDQRVAGASVAAKQRAVAVLVRSVTTLPDDLPHAGLFIYALWCRLN